MKCEECGTETRVKETFNDGATVHRLRQCTNDKCLWMCNTTETYIERAYSPSHMRKKAQEGARA